MSILKHFFKIESFPTLHEAFCCDWITTQYSFKNCKYYCDKIAYIITGFVFHIVSLILTFRWSMILIH